MFPYWTLFAVFAAGAVQYRPDARRMIQGGPLLLAMALATAVMIGLRYRVGGDWNTYLENMRVIADRELLQGAFLQDPAYGAMNWAFGRMGIGIWAVNLFCALIFTWGLLRFARRQPNPWLVMVIAVPYLIIVVAMGYTRQAVAIGLILAALADLENRSLTRFVVFILVAAAFHKSAIVIVPLVALTATRRRIVTIAVLALSAVLVYYLFVQASLEKLSAGYIEQQYNSQGAAIRVAMNLPPAIIFMLFRRRFGLSPQQSSLWRNFSLASFVALVMLFLSASSTAVDRLALYLIPLQMMVLGRLPSAFPERQRFNSRLMLLVVIYSAFIQFVWLNYAANASYWVPYRLGLASLDDELQ